MQYKKRVKFPSLHTRLFSFRDRILRLFGARAKLPYRNYLSVPRKVMKAIKQHGYSKQVSVVDYWFKHRDEILDKYFDKIIDSEIIEFETTHRWLTEMGIACRAELLRFISNSKNYVYMDGLQNESKRKHKHLDLMRFQFEFNREVHNLESFSRKFRTYRVPDGFADLSGIKLDGVNFDSCNLFSISFEHAQLYNCKFNNAGIVKVWFNNANLKCCRFSSVEISKSNFRNTNISGSQFAHSEFNDKWVNNSIVFKRVQYRYLFVSLLSQWMGKFQNDILMDDIFRIYKHNSFLNCSTKGLSTPESKSLRNYIDWYQYVMYQIGNGYRFKSTLDKCFLVISVVCTKAWTSYFALFVAGFAIVSIFAVVFKIAPECAFSGLDGTYLTSFYYSVVTFTTLGYGDVSPTVGWARVLVIIEVLLGYITLGSFVFLIGHKVNDRY